MKWKIYSIRARVHLSSSRPDLGAPAGENSKVKGINQGYIGLRQAYIQSMLFTCTTGFSTIYVVPSAESTPTVHYEEKTRAQKKRKYVCGKFQLCFFFFFFHSIRESRRQDSSYLQPSLLFFDGYGISYLNRIKMKNMYCDRKKKKQMDPPDSQLVFPLPCAARRVVPFFNKE